MRCRLGQRNMSNCFGFRILWESRIMDESKQYFSLCGPSLSRAFVIIGSMCFSSHLSQNSLMMSL